MKLERLTITLNFERAICTIFLITALANISGCSQLPKSHGEIISATETEQLDLKFGVVRMLERNGSLLKARKSYLSILESHPDYSPAIHRLGVVAVTLEELDLALEYLNRAVDAGSPTSNMLGDLGYAQFLARDLEAANETLSSALEMDPTNERFVNNLAIVLGNQGQIADCLELFRHVNSESEALANTGFVLSQTGDIEAAKQYFHRALELEPGLETAANGLVEFYRLEHLEPAQTPLSNSESIRKMHSSKESPLVFHVRDGSDSAKAEGE